MALIDEINSFCRTHILPILVDNIFKSNITQHRFFKNAKKWNGGTKIEGEIEYAKNSNAESYSGAGKLTIGNVEIGTKCYLDPRQYNVAVTITGLQEAQNKSPARVIDLVKARMKNAEKSLSDLLGTHFFATQTGTNLDGVGGVFAAVGGTAYAGIDPTDFPGWRTNDGSGPTDISGNLTKANFETLYMQAMQDTDKPTLIVTTDALWGGIDITFIEANKRYEDKKLANMGFDNITMHGTPITMDSHCPSGVLYLFNENYLKVHTLLGGGRDSFKFIPFQSPRDYDTKTAHLRWYGNLLCTNLARQAQAINVNGVA